MSPFAHQQELWLTAHLQRLVQRDLAIKIQAVVRGFLIRRRQEKKRRLSDQWKDYQAIQASVSPDSVSKPSFWNRFTQWIWD